MSKADKCPFRLDDCFGFGYYGRCNVCDSTNFSGEQCPFYKTKETRLQEHCKSVDRLNRIGRLDLVMKYGKNERQPLIWREITDA